MSATHPAEAASGDGTPREKAAFARRKVHAVLSFCVIVVGAGVGVGGGVAAAVFVDLTFFVLWDN